MTQKPGKHTQDATSSAQRDERVSIAERVAQRLAQSGTQQPPSRPTRPATRVAQKAGERLRSKGKADPATADAPQPESSTRGAIAKAPLERSELPQDRFNLDFTKLHLDGFVSPMGENSQISEEFRVIKRPLLVNAFKDEKTDKNSHVMMVTSSRPSEGKSFTSINLALSMAFEKDIYVLLIDTDIHQRGLERVLRYEKNRKGLVDLLDDETLDVSDVMMRTNFPNLSILPAGTRNPHATELIASKRMEAFIDDVASRYPDRIIIIDAPPILASSEPGVLAMHVGQVIMVVEAYTTPESTLLEALGHLKMVPKINLVLNKVDESFRGDRFGSYYGAYTSSEKQR